MVRITRKNMLHSQVTNDKGEKRVGKINREETGVTRKMGKIKEEGVKASKTSIPLKILVSDVNV